MPLASALSGEEAKPHRNWLSKTFGFNLKNFLPGGGALSLRRFSIAEATFLLILAFITSRGLGVIRQTLFNILFGTGPEANAYYAAAYLPETLFDLIAGGALSHAFIPVFLSHEKVHGQREAWRLTSLVFNMMLVALTLLVIIGEFLAPAFVNHWLVPGYSPMEQSLTTTLTRIMLIQPLFLGLGTVLNAALNSKRQFLLPAVSVAIYNVGLIGGLAASYLFREVGIYGPTVGILVAAALQAFVMLPPLIKQGARYSFTWNFKHPALLEVLRLLIPNTLAVAVASIAPIIDTAFISYMPDSASLSAQRNAYMLFALPFALVSQAVGQAALPRLAFLSTAQKYVRLRATVFKVVGATVVCSILSSIALYLFGKPAIQLLFQHGAFDAHSSFVTHIALMGYAIALPGHAAATLLILTFYGMKSAITPLFATCLTIFTHVGSAFLFLHLFTGSYKVMAISLAVATDGIATSLLLGILLFLRLRHLVKEDQGMQRLTRWKAYQSTQQKL